MTDFLTADTNLPSYMMFPRFLLDMEINETAKMLYIILLDRARLSQKNEGWSDTDGHVFIYFTIEALAEVLHKSQMTVINVNIKMYIFDHLRMYIFAILPLDRYIFLSDKIFL